MSDHLIEIIFKDISVEKIGHLLTHLTAKGRQIISYNATVEIPAKIDWSAEQQLYTIFATHSQCGIFLNLKILESNGISLPNCGIAIYKNADLFNLEVNFQLIDIKTIALTDLVPSLMKFAKSLASTYGVAEFLCGLEPAEDYQTRLFTNEQIGPFLLKIDQLAP